MKYNVKKDGKKITLTVNLSKKEMQADENIAFGYRSAREYLLAKGHKVGRLLSESAAANKGSNASRNGEFVYELEEEVASKKKTVPKSPKTPAVTARKPIIEKVSDK